MDYNFSDFSRTPAKSNSHQDSGVQFVNKMRNLGSGNGKADTVNLDMHNRYS